VPLPAKGDVPLGAPPERKRNEKVFVLRRTEFAESISFICDMFTTGRESLSLACVTCRQGDSARRKRWVVGRLDARCASTTRSSISSLTRTEFAISSTAIPSRTTRDANGPLRWTLSAAELAVAPDAAQPSSGFQFDRAAPVKALCC
jgi:hypothetical protein